MRFLVVLATSLATQLPAQVASDEVRVATSALHTLVIAPGGRVLCQGRNQYGVCGADLATAFVETLSPVPGIPRGRAVAVADTWTSMVLGEDGKVYVWGQNNFGLFGGTDRGPTYVQPQPKASGGARTRHRDRGVRVRRCSTARRRHGVDVGGGPRGPAGHRRAHEVVGSRASRSSRRGAWRASRESRRSRAARQHMLALKSDGTVWVWGANKYAQLGLGDTDPRARPTNIPSLAGVTRIHAASTMSAARQADGSWVVWGAVPSTQPPTRDVFGGVLNDMPPVLTRRRCQACCATPATWRTAPSRFVTAPSAHGVATRSDRSVRAAAWTRSSARGVLVKSLSGIVRVWAGVPSRACTQVGRHALPVGPGGYGRRPCAPCAHGDDNIRAQHAAQAVRTAPSSRRGWPAQPKRNEEGLLETEQRLACPAEAQRGRSV